MSWELEGNSGINSDRDFLGTKDDKPLIFKTDGAERGRLTAGGTLEIKQDIVVGAGDNATIHARHIDGKQVGADGPGELCLNYATGTPVFIGKPDVKANLQVFGTILASDDIVLENADCAEEFTVTGSGAVEPGTVMVLVEGGALRPCEWAYDKKVAGVVSGAGSHKPALVLDKRYGCANRLPVALVGKVYCKVDANHAPIETGDLLTTSPTPGHAMKAADPMRAFGSVIGKALASLKGGSGLIPILVALQ